MGGGDGWVKPGDGNWEIDHGMHLYICIVSSRGRTGDHSCDVVS